MPVFGGRCLFRDFENSKEANRRISLTGKIMVLEGAAFDVPSQGSLAEVLSTLIKVTLTLIN